MMIFRNVISYVIYDNNKHIKTRDVFRYSLQSPSYRFFEIKELTPIQKNEIKNKADKIHDERIAKILEETTPLYQDVGRIVASYVARYGAE